MIHQPVTETEGTSVGKDSAMPLAVHSSASDSSTISRNSSPIQPKSPSPPPMSVPTPMIVSSSPLTSQHSSTQKSSPAAPAPTTDTHSGNATALSCGQNAHDMNPGMPSTACTRSAVPDPIGSSVEWGGGGTNVRIDNANDGNINNPNSTSLSVGGSCTNESVRNTSTVTTAVTDNMAAHHMKSNATVAQIASRGGIRHNVGGKLSVPVPIPVPVPVHSMPDMISDPISAPSPTSSLHVTPTPVPHTIQSMPSTPVGDISTNYTNSGANVNSNSNSNSHCHSNMAMVDERIQQKKKSPRLDGMEDKSSRSFSLSLPDPASFSSVPNACSSSVSASVSGSVSTSASASSTVAPTTVATTAATTAMSISSASTSATATPTSTNLPLSAQYGPMTQMSATIPAPVTSASSLVGVGVGNPHPPDRKQKRLQRNRESARLSRRRRKQYLEVLEERVNFLCEEMDRGRREHVLSAVSTIRAMRSEVMNAILEGVLASSSGSGSGSRSKDSTGSNGQNINMSPNTMNTSGMISQELYEKMNMLLDFRDTVDLRIGLLSRMSQELMLAITFGREYLKSLVIPPSKKYIMWLTLQNDIFFRGGRAASERLSAARIGEKLRSCGHTQVPPCNGMWPLFCNEVSLSYDQEERIRSLQKEILSNQNTWLDRHTGAASEHILTSSHDAIRGATERTESRRKSLVNILTPEQKIKFLAWVERKKRADGQKLIKLMQSCKLFSSAMDESSDDDFQVNDKQHDSANLYILNHKFGDIAQKLPLGSQTLPPPKVLKKFTRRPAFESLATMEDSKGGGPKKGRKMSRDMSSTSLKRTSSEMSMDDGGSLEHGNFMKRSTSGASLSGSINPSLTPEMAQTTSATHVFAALGPISSLIPPNRLARHTASQAHFVLPSALTNEIPLMPDHTQHQVSTTVQTSHPAAQVSQDVAMQSQPLQNNLNVPKSFNSQSSSVANVPTQSFNARNTSNKNQQSFTFSIPDPVPVLPLQNSFEQQQNQAAYPQPTLSSSRSAPALRQSNVPSPLVQPMAAVKEELPCVPLDDINFWGVSNQMADDSLFELTEEDWAIGEALF